MRYLLECFLTNASLRRKMPEVAVPVAAAALKGALNDSVLPARVPLGFAHVLEPHASEIRFFCQRSHPQLLTFISLFSSE